MMTVRYHIQLSKHRTTVSVDKIVSDLLAVKLGFKPDTPEAYQAVARRLDNLVTDRGRSGHRLSHYVTQEAILDLVDNILSKKYDDYLDELYNKTIKR
jgi:metal-dependent HD superfamily phosphatase/phosphodiesterase